MANLLYGDWIQISLSIGTWFFGIVGAFFILRQNTILSHQNSLMADQNNIMKTQNELDSAQAELNKILFERERSAQFEQDVMGTIRRIGIGAIKKEEEVKREVKRLWEKGITDAELRWFSYEVFNRNSAAAEKTAVQLSEVLKHVRMEGVLKNAKAEISDTTAD